MELLQNVSSPFHDILSVVCRALSFIDPRLVEHGERVAYLALETARRLPDCGGFDFKSLTVLALLHDIGAYKTEEIGDMVRFETENVSNHAVYGYLFLRSAGGLGENARAILYHHAPWSRMRDVQDPCRDSAALIFLADRADILSSASGCRSFEPLRRYSGSLFRPEYVDALLRADREAGLCARLHSGCADETARLIHEARLTDAEASAYLRMLVYAIDFRSSFTVTHTVNTVAISRELGRLLALDEQEMEALQYGAFLHDVGKIAIPIEILESPNRLSAAEMAVMRTHVITTREIIDGLVSPAVRDIACRHHEKLNGSGYPDGLTGGELTLPQRIVAVADVLSALISRRSYKEPFPAARAQAILREMRDRNELSPQVCDTLLLHYDEVMTRVEADRDPIIRLYEEMQREYQRLLSFLRVGN